MIYPFYRYQTPNTLFCLIARYLHLVCIGTLLLSLTGQLDGLFANKETEAKGLPIKDKSCESY